MPQMIPAWRAFALVGSTVDGQNDRMKPVRAEKPAESPEVVALRKSVRGEPLTDAESARCVAREGDGRWPISKNVVAANKARRGEHLDAARARAPRCRS